MIKLLEERVQPVVVPAVLEHEAIAGLTGRPAAIRGRAGSSSRQLESPVSSEAALDALHANLKKIHRTLQELGVDPEITAQIFKQVSRWDDVGGRERVFNWCDDNFRLVWTVITLRM